MTDLYIDRKYVGKVAEAKQFISNFIAERKKGVVDANVNIGYDKLTDEINIETSRGRARRPLIVVRDGVSLLTDKHLRQVHQAFHGKRRR